MDLDRLLMALGAVSAFTGVGLGAFGAHGLRKRLSGDMLAGWACMAWAAVSA